MSVLVKKIALHAILPLITGLVIYVIARPDTWLTQKLPPFRLYFMEKTWDRRSAGWFMKALAFNGPDFCWSYSITSALLFWKYFSGIKQYHFLLFILLLILAQEFVQLFLPVYFTFDILDIIAAVMAFLLSLLLNRKYV